METEREDGLVPVMRGTAEAIARAAYDAVHGVGAFNDLSILGRDDAIKAAQEAANDAGLGSVPW